MSSGQATSEPSTPRQLGRTGIGLFPIGLGAMPLSLRGRPNERAALGVIHAALEAGVTFIDTANAYCIEARDVGHNERLIASALREWKSRGGVTVATKGGLIRPGGAWKTEGRPDHLRRACEQSLRDLGVETIDLYQLHTPDGRVAWADQVGELARLQAEGKIRHIGLSNVSAAELRQALAIVRVESVQNRCNPTDQGDLKSGLVRACAEEGVTYLPYSPVGGHQGHKRMGRQRALSELAKRHGTSPQCIMLAWLLGKGAHVVPIPGASRVASITDSCRAVEVRLSADDTAQVDAMG